MKCPVLSTKECAVAIRTALKRRYVKSIRFSVRVEGSGVAIKYMDGPSEEEVTEYLKRFNSRRGDYSEDIKQVPVEIDGQMVIAPALMMISRSYSVDYVTEALNYYAKKTAINNDIFPVKFYDDTSDVSHPYFTEDADYDGDIDELREQLAAIREIMARCNTYGDSIADQEYERAEKELEKELATKYIESGLPTFDSDLDDEPQDIGVTEVKGVEPFSVKAKFATLNKQGTIDGYIDQIAKDEYEIFPVEIIGIYEMSPEDYTHFTYNFVARYKFLEGLDTQRLEDDEGKPYIRAITVRCQKSYEAVVINTEGFNYARYVGVVDDETRILINRIYSFSDVPDEKYFKSTHKHKHVYKGIRVDVYRNTSIDGDCSLNGTSARHEELLLIGEGIPPITTEFNPDKVVEVKRSPYDKKYIYARPVAFKENVHSMNGGNFVYTCDSRFSDELGYRPIPVHDRVES